MREVISNSGLLVFLIISLVFGCNQKTSEIKANENEAINQLSALADEKFDRDIFDEAEKLYSQLIALKINEPKFYFRRGYCLVMLSNYSKANENYMKSASLGHLPGESYYNIGINYGIMGSDSLANVNHIKAKEFIPDHERNNEMLEYYEQQKK